MRTALCGGTGFIGSALAEALSARGDEVWIITRSKPAAPAAGLLYATWDEWQAAPDLTGPLDAIVNLSGESIGRRWTREAKRRIVSSRQDAAARIAGIVGRMQHAPATLVNASAISVYGHAESSGGRYPAPSDEGAPASRSDFLSETIVQWENAADRIPVGRIVKLRIGLALGKSGGSYPMLSLPTKLYAGGRLGSGRQGMPWIHIDDIVGLILLCLDTPAISGPVNAVAPETVDNDAFGRVLAKVLRRPYWLHAPAWAIRAALGEMSALLLTGQFAVPRKALGHGYEFRFPRLAEALRDIEGQA
ncbi:TIGR01777 family oxidoreductase [Cohnella sp. JJ-181]|uniref:TIGR01777 family oxidoreductase n=1 Tax=Cohnella rhizoplanae TaxID=2974897 RepID=UPI0022FF8345|nr:TIGR01777 family oxidoreductase [Cohnella sp. JJ-181]CAI6079124.1 Epimerase family protein [Cohnella sp. JJ-181]